MSYDLHVIRAANWFDASKNPINKEEVDHLIAADPELQWSTTDYVDMQDGHGTITRYFLIEWRGKSCFRWYGGEIISRGDDQEQLRKLLRIADYLKCRVVGDDGESYRLSKNWLGVEKIAIDHSR